jgi:DNA-binding IclR family transcriptional regulator
VYIGTSHARFVVIDGQGLVQRADDETRRRRPAGGAARGPVSSRNSTADRAIDLLMLFNDNRRVVTAMEVANDLGTSRSTTYRYLQSLKTYGLLEDDPNGFRLGPTILELARLARKGFGLSEIALPIMRDLVTTTNETVLLTRRHYDRVVTLEREEPARTTIRLSYERGQVLPIHAGASAKVLIAFADEAEIDRILATAPLQRFTSKTVTDPARLRVELDEIRALGFARSYGELDEGVVGIGAPIFQGGEVVAGLSVAAVQFRSTKADISRMTDLVCRSAQEISDRIAHID